MKKIILSLFLYHTMLLPFQMVKCQNDTILNVISNNNSLIVQFNLPSFEIIDTILAAPYGILEIFNYIKIDDDEFGIIDSVGLPELPQLSFDLHVPHNATGFEIRIASAETTKIGINRRIMPSQEDIELEKPVFNFSMNNRYYNSSGGFCNFYFQFNESFIVFGEQGINLTIFPFIYNPDEKSLIVLNNAIFEVCYTLLETPKESYYTETKENYLHSIFKNYELLDNSKMLNTEIYLMITPPEYESTLTYFANYKRNIGYDVKVVTTNIIGSSVSSIKNYIQNQYNNTSTRPTYVLLVGDIDKIPVYEGNTSTIDKENPTTDLGYSLLEGSDNLADVFLGRFSVSNNDDLKNIINKTIYMEMNMHRFPKKAKFWAGTDETSNWIYMESEFRRGHNYVIPYSFEPLGYNCEKLYQPNPKDKVIYALNDNPLFYLYSGHGDISDLNGYYAAAFTSYEVNNTVFPCFFAFACKSGHYFSPICMGEGLTRAKNKGVVSYFGCSVNSQTNSDNAIEKKIFGDSFLKDERNLSAIINVGMRRFTYVAGISSKTKNIYLKAYNLLGDPSFDTKGIGCKQNFVFNNPEVFKQDVDVTYRADNLIQNNDSFIVETGANVKLLAGNSIVLNPGFGGEAGSNVEIGIVPCDDGTIHKSFSQDNNEKIFDNTESAIQNEINNEISFSIETDEIIDPALFSVFPNPATDDFSLAYTIENNGFVQIDLYNITGVHVKNFLQMAQQEAGVYYHNFSLSGLSSGLYILVLKNTSKTFSTKIIKH